MSDTRTREIERRWRETGADADRLAYASELKRAGRYEDIARVYQPILEETPSTHQEYLKVSPVSERDAQNLQVLLDKLTIFDGTRKWLIGSSIIRPNYKDIDVLIYSSEFGITELPDHLSYEFPEFLIISSIWPPQNGSAYASIDSRIRGILNETLFDLCFTRGQFDDTRFRMRLR